MTRGVARPVATIARTMGMLVEGDSKVDVPYTDRKDEVGDAARAALAFKESLIRNAELEEVQREKARIEAARAREMADVVEHVGVAVAAAAQGDFSKRISVNTTEQHLRGLVDGVNTINEVVDRATGDISSALTSIAAGDLTRPVEADYKGRFGDLKAAVNETIARLSETVSTIQVTAGEVAVSAREISSGADDLSRRTEGQAASLEQTAATTEELSASVKNTAEASRQAVQLAEDARNVADQGGAIVQRAVQAMNRIEDQSQKIQQITSVIDTIAFQTNLLALNAAVEAARAGDAGKGFAVVASEVRSLAQRSSEAAKDIAGLISTSASEIAEGVGLVRSAGDALVKIVDSSAKVSATVAEISTATAEQAHGIDEMGQAISHMDQMTQQNAALSEESAASANSMLTQMQRLEQLVAAFRTSARVRPAVQAADPRRLQDAVASAFREMPDRAPDPAPAQRVRARATGTEGGRWEEF
jgi:methyl-accepting chemotaxis protein